MPHNLKRLGNYIHKVSLSANNERWITKTPHLNLLGIIGYWVFPDYLYIEHYAINTALRGQGLGSRILNDLQKNADRPIILEIDEVIDEISTRRLRFYQHLGFVMNPYYHPLPQYRIDPQEHTQARLMILTYPQAIPPQTYEQFNRDLNQIVMKRD